MYAQFDLQQINTQTMTIFSPIFIFAFPTSLKPQQHSYKLSDNYIPIIFCFRNQMKFTQNITPVKEQLHRFNRTFHPWKSSSKINSRTLNTTKNRELSYDEKILQNSTLTPTKTRINPQQRPHSSMTNHYGFRNKKSKKNFTSKDKSRKSSANQQFGGFGFINFSKKKRIKHCPKTDAHDLFQKTFDACQGYRYISFNKQINQVKKHPQLKMRNQVSSEYANLKNQEKTTRYCQSELLNRTDTPKNLTRRPITFRNVLDENNESNRFFSPKQNIFAVSEMFLGGKARFEFDRRANKSPINKLTLVNHTGKPIKYYLKKMKPKI